MASVWPGSLQVSLRPKSSGRVRRTGQVHHIAFSRSLPYMRERSLKEECDERSAIIQEREMVVLGGHFIAVFILFFFFLFSFFLSQTFQHLLTASFPVWRISMFLPSTPGVLIQTFLSSCLCQVWWCYPGNFCRSPVKGGNVWTWTALALAQLLASSLIIIIRVYVSYTDYWVAFVTSYVCLLKFQKNKFPKWKYITFQRV